MSSFRFTTRFSSLLAIAMAVGLFAMAAPAFAAVPWYLDRLDQHSLPLDGQYNPCGSAPGVGIFIVSSGIDPTLPEFGGRTNVFYDALGGDGIDRVGHGTWLASLAAGTEHGVAKSAQVYGVRAFDDCGRTTLEILHDALIQIAANGPRPAVVVLPFAFADVPELDAMAEEVRMAGCIVVTAGGDEDRNACELSPARSPWTVTASACDTSYERAPWAAYGSCVDVYAPGAGITAPWIGPEGTATIDTSGASAALAGGVAAIYSRQMNFSDIEPTLRSCTGGNSLPLLRICCGGGPGPGPGPVAPTSVPGQTPGAPLDWYRLVDDFVVCTADVDANCNVGFPDLTTLLAGWGPCPLGDEQMFGIGVYGHLFQIDMTTGAGTLLGDIGFDNVEGMACDSQNGIFVSAERATGEDLIVLVDPAATNGSLVATLSGMPDPGEILALAFDSSDTLYAAISTGLFQNVMLARVELSTGVVTIIGDTGLQAIAGLSFDSNDTLYFMSNMGGRIGTIDVGTGLASLPIGSGHAASQTLEFNATGRLYAAFNDLVEIDPATGLHTPIGAIGYPVRGLAMVRDRVDCRLDFDGSGDVDFADLTLLLNTWGDCP